MKHLIIDAVNTALRSAERDHYQRRQNHAICEVQRDLWFDLNPDDGVGSISRNPYRPESLVPGVGASAKTLKNWQAAMAFAVKTFIEEEDE